MLEPLPDWCALPKVAGMSDVVSKQKIQKKSFSILGPFSELN
jgi:hypothetical protein